MVAVKLNYPIDKIAPDFKLQGISGHLYALEDLCTTNPLLLVFYLGGKLRPFCKDQFNDYRDSFAQFEEFKLKIVGISSDHIDKQKEFARDFDYPFDFLSDPGNKVSKIYNIGSRRVFGGAKRAVYIIGPEKRILYGHIETNWMSRRSSQDLIAVLSDLKKVGLI